MGGAPFWVIESPGNETPVSDPMIGAISKTKIVFIVSWGMFFSLSHLWEALFSRGMEKIGETYSQRSTFDSIRGAIKLLIAEIANKTFLYGIFCHIILASLAPQRLACDV